MLMRSARCHSRVARWGFLLLLALALPFQPALASDNVSPQKLEALKKRIHAINHWLDQAQASRSSLENSVRDLEKKIGELNSQLHQLQQKAQGLRDRLNQLDQKQAAIKARLESRRKSLEAQLRAAWMQGSSPAIKVLLNQENPQRLARTMTYYRYLSQDNIKSLEHYNDLLARLDANRKQVTQTRAQLADTRSQLADRRDQLAQKQSQRKVALGKLVAKIQDRKQELKHLKANRDRLEKLLNQVQDAVANLPMPGKNKPFHKLRGRLPWPLKGKVIGHFGAPLAGGKLRRTGIVIKTADKTPVRAVDYGRVVFANWLRGFGLLIIVDHGHGYMSLYGHNSSLLKAPGDWVSAGDTIALAGNSGQSGAPDLYFAIRHNGKPENPLRWLRH